MPQMPCDRLLDAADSAADIERPAIGAEYTPFGQQRRKFGRGAIENNGIAERIERHRRFGCGGNRLVVLFPGGAEPIVATRLGQTRRDKTGSAGEACAMRCSEPPQVQQRLVSRAAKPVQAFPQIRQCASRQEQVHQCDLG
jgi:hypothetical protein